MECGHPETTPTPHPPAVGVLAGGESRRFPGDKLRADFAGRPLLQRVLGRLEAVAPRRFLLGRPALDPPAGWEPLPDVPDHPGPFGGLLALAGCLPEGFLLAAGDMPHLDADLLRRLWGASAGHPAAYLVVGAQPQPLVSAFRPAGVRALLGRAWRSGTGPLAALRAVGARAVDGPALGLSPAALGAAITDVDTPEALAAALAMEQR